MTKQTVQTLKGFRDFLPAEKRRRDFVAKKVTEIFERFGFEPVETPTLEYAALILGKYGEEADKLVYSFEDQGKRQVALRYDQTVPTARVLAQYQNELPRYFRRYQIQNVFRADKPQKGRYREFTQCDIDIFNSTSPIADAEVIACTYFAFKNVGYPTVILRINDRQILFKTLEPYSTPKVSVLSIIQSIDKLDKQTEAQVTAELVTKGLKSAVAIKALQSIKAAKQSANLQEIIQATIELGVPQKAIEFTPSLARGLDYYTGMIYEVIIPEYPLGSFGGGGRYDKLIGQLGGVEIPAVGIAFGFDRMVEAATALNLCPQNTTGTTVLITVFDDKTKTQSLETAAKLRQAGVNTEIFPSLEKLDKQLKYANKKGIPYVAIIGENEAKSGEITLKNLSTGDQQTLPLDKLLSVLK